MTARKSPRRLTAKTGIPADERRARGQTLLSVRLDAATSTRLDLVTERTSESRADWARRKILEDFEGLPESVRKQLATKQLKARVAPRPKLANIRITAPAAPLTEA